MGLISTLFGEDDHHGWEDEFDRRVKSGQWVDTSMPGKPRVADSQGNFFTRDGKKCCGCGKTRNYTEWDADSYTYHDKAGGDAPTVEGKSKRSPLF